MNESKYIAVGPSHPTAAALLLALAQALHEHGTPAHRLEDSLNQAARGLGLGAAQFLSTPTAMHLGFGEGLAQRVHMQRLHGERVDLEALGELDAIVDDVSGGRLGPADGLARLAALARRPARYGSRATRWASAAASASAALLLGGDGAELLVAGLLGLGVGALAQATAAMPRARSVFEPLAALLTSLGTTLLGTTVCGLADGVILVAALIMLVPGLTLTVAMTELASGHLVSGTARLAGAMTLLLTMLFGAALGRVLAASLVLPVTLPRPDLPAPPGAELLGLAIAAVAFTILLRARPRDGIWIALACSLGFGAAHLGSRGLGPELGAFVGAVTIGVASNVFARSRRRPATLLRLPGLLLLVPGSLGFRSVASLLDADTVAGTDGLFRVALVAVALAAGSFAADLFVPPRRSL